LGVFAYDERRKLTEKVLFPKDKIIEGMDNCKKEDLSKEEKDLIKKIKDKRIVFEVRKKNYEHKFPNLTGEILRETLEGLALKEKFAKNKEEFNDLMYRINSEITIQKMRSLDVNDKIIIQSINAIDELDKTANLLTTRLREWYGLYFPELCSKIKENEEFARTISEDVKKDMESIGSSFSGNDLKEMQELARTVSLIYRQRKELEKYIERKVREIAPNMDALIGGQLSAKLIALAGSLEKLAKYPSSTIQILGGEKSLFRFLNKETKRGPRYGIIFNTPYIQKAQDKKRGKVARILAGKLSLAAKVDFYKGKFIGDKLKEDLDKKIRRVIE
jgi:nucleolar protein 56